LSSTNEWWGKIYLFKGRAVTFAVSPKNYTEFSYGEKGDENGRNDSNFFIVFIISESGESSNVIRHSVQIL
jgi:hypothetical protein